VYLSYLLSRRGRHHDNDQLHLVQSRLHSLSFSSSLSCVPSSRSTRSALAFATNSESEALSANARCHPHSFSPNSLIFPLPLFWTTFPFRSSYDSYNEWSQWTSMSGTAIKFESEHAKQPELPSTHHIFVLEFSLSLPVCQCAGSASQNGLPSASAGHQLAPIPANQRCTCLADRRST
jgi:hypothetical protein